MTPCVNVCLLVSDIFKNLTDGLEKLVSKSVFGPRSILPTGIGFCLPEAAPCLPIHLSLTNSIQQIEIYLMDTDAIEVLDIQQWIKPYSLDI